MSNQMDEKTMLAKKLKFSSVAGGNVSGVATVERFDSPSKYENSQDPLIPLSGTVSPH